MGDWIAFWDSEHSIYVNARHRDVHYRRIAQDIRTHLPAGAAVLDYGCGEALHADIIAETARRLILCEAAPTVRAALGRRFGNNPKIEVRAPEEIAALPSGSSIDMRVRFTTYSANGSMSSFMLSLAKWIPPASVFCTSARSRE